MGLEMKIQPLDSSRIFEPTSIESCIKDYHIRKIAIAAIAVGAVLSHNPLRFKAAIIFLSVGSIVLLSTTVYRYWLEKHRTNTLDKELTSLIPMLKESLEWLKSTYPKKSDYKQSRMNHVVLGNKTSDNVKNIFGELNKMPSDNWNGTGIFDCLTRRKDGYEGDISMNSKCFHERVEECLQLNQTLTTDEGTLSVKEMREKLVAIKGQLLTEEMSKELVRQLGNLDGLTQQEVMPWNNLRTSLKGIQNDLKDAWENSAEVTKKVEYYENTKQRLVKLGIKDDHFNWKILFGAIELVEPK